MPGPLHRADGDQPERRINGDQPPSWPGVIAVVGGSCLILLVMSLPYFCGVPYRVDDLRDFHYPVRVFYSECLSQGNQFEWMPTLFAGYFVAGEGQMGAYHPVHLLLYSVFPVQAAFALEILLSYPFMLVGAYLLFRHVVGRRDAAALGAMTFTFGAFNGLHFIHPNAVAVVSHIPWLLFAIHVAAQGSGWRRLSAEVSIPLLTASQLLLGYPQYVWFSLLAEGAWAVFVFRSHWGRYVRLAGLMLIGLLLGAIQLVPTWSMLQESERSSTSMDFLMDGSLEPANLIQVFTPYLIKGRTIGGNTHEFGFYLGAVPLVMAYWLLFRYRWQGADRRLLRAIFAFLLFALVLAFGRFGGLAILQTYLPAVGNFRVPARALVLANLAVAGLVAIGCEKMLQLRDGQEQREVAEMGRRLTVFSVLILAAAYLAIRLRFGAEFLASWPSVLAGPVLVAIGSVLCFQLGKRKTLAVLAVILFTAADLGFYGLSYTVAPIFWPPAEDAAMEPPPGMPGERIVADPRTFGNSGHYQGNDFIEDGFTRVDGYSGLQPRTQLFGEEASISALRAAGVRWVCRSADPKDTTGLNRVDDTWWEVPDPLPRIRLATQTLQSSRPSDDIGRIDIQTTVLLEQPLELDESPVGQATLVREEPGRLIIQTVATSEQLLVLTDRHHPAWSVEIDGDRGKVMRVNGDFMGCVVPAGQHLIVWTFQPLSVRRGLWGTTLGAFLLALYILFRGWNMRQSVKRVRS